MLIELSAVSLQDGVLAHAKMLNKRISSEQGELYACSLGVIFKPTGKTEALIPWVRVSSAESKDADAFAGHYLTSILALAQPAAVAAPTPATTAAPAAVEENTSGSKWGGRRK